MAKSKTKSISFKEKYFEEFEYLQEQENPSNFICELIRKHMTSREDDFENRVKDILLKFLGNQNQVPYQIPLTDSQNIEENLLQKKIEDIEDPW